MMDPLTFLRTHRFRAWCPLCKCFRDSINCRLFNHSGIAGYDFERETPILADRCRR